MYIPTVSDCHALVVRLETVSITSITSTPPSSPLPPATTSMSFYWKLNSTILNDTAFLPAFTSYWMPVVATQPAIAALVPDWWDNIAKPAVVAFCRSFSVLLAAKCCQPKPFFTTPLLLLPLSLPPKIGPLPPPKPRPGRLAC